MLGLVVVWGNCQAAPLADLLRAPLAVAGLEVVDVPPVFLVSEVELARVHRIVRNAAVLISHPVREEYRFPGCSTSALAAELPSTGRLVTVSSAYHTGPFPFLVNAHGADGARVDAPLTDYHDLRAVVAASRGMSVDEASAWWPQAPAAAVRNLSEESLRELSRREQALDVSVADLVHDRAALWSMNHPANFVLSQIACRVLFAAGFEGTVQAPARQYLGERKAPIEQAVSDALGWTNTPQDSRHEWVVQEREIDRRAVISRHLDFYERRPDVVADTLRRHAARVAKLIAA